MDSPHEDPLHRLSRTQTNACRQHQWAVWQEAEKGRRTPVKAPPKSRSPIRHPPGRSPVRSPVRSIPVRSPTRRQPPGRSPRKVTSPHAKKTPNRTAKTPTSTNSPSSVRANVTSPADPNTRSLVSVPTVIVTKPDPRISGLSFASATNNRRVLELFDETKAKDLFDRLDDNASGKLSLAELDKGIVTLFPEDFNHKPAIMRAYKATDTSGDGFVSRNEFGFFLNYMVYYNNLWIVFRTIDEDGDRRISREEWMEATANDEQLEGDVFDQVDTNGGGMVLFDELCKYMTTATTNAKVEVEADKLVGNEDDVAKLSIGDAADDDTSY